MSRHAAVYPNEAIRNLNIPGLPDARECVQGALDVEVLPQEGEGGSDPFEADPAGGDPGVPVRGDHDAVREDELLRDGHAR